MNGISRGFCPKLNFISIGFIIVILCGVIPSAESIPAIIQFGLAYLGYKTLIEPSVEPTKHYRRGIALPSANCTNLTAINHGVEIDNSKNFPAAVGFLLMLFIMVLLVLLCCCCSECYDRRKIERNLEQLNHEAESKGEAIVIEVQ